MRFILIYFFLLHSALGFSQNINLKFKYFEPSNGFPDVTVFSLVQDQQGFIWIGSSDGLIRFDGIHFKTYKNTPFSKKQLADGNIRDILVDDEGLLWLITDLGGITIFDAIKEKFTIIKHDAKDRNSLADNAAYAAVQDFEGDIWIAHITNGLSKYNKRTKIFTHYVHDAKQPFSLSDNHLQNIFLDRKGNIWLGTQSQGVCYFDKSQNKFFSIRNNADNKNALVSNFVNSLNEDLEGNMWFGTDKGISKWNKASNVYTTYTKEKNGIASNYIYNSKMNADGLLFFSSQFGLTIINPKTDAVQTYKRDSTLKETPSAGYNSCVDLLFDKDRNFWMQTVYGFAFSPKVVNEINTYESISGVKSERCNDFIRNNNLWSYDGKKIIAKNLCDANIKIFNIPNDLLPKFNASTIRFLQGSNSKQAIAVKDLGICILDLENNRMNILPKLNFTQTVLQPDDFGLGFLDSENNFWAVYQNSLIYYSSISGSWTQFNSANAHCDIDAPNYISEFMEDNSGNLWMASFNKFVFKYNFKSKTFVQYKYYESDNYSVSGYNHVALYQDKKNRIWLGGLGRSLDLYDAKRNRFIHFNREHLFDNQIFNIGEDYFGNLWVFNRSSIVKFVPPNDTDMNQAFHEDFAYVKFDDPKFINGSEHAASYLIQDCAGQFYFSNTSGKYVLNPKSFNASSLPAPIYFTEFKLFSDVLSANDSMNILKKNISTAQTIDLAYDQNTFSIAFALLSYSYASSNKFSYRLDGLDDKWQYANAINSDVSYSKLEPGKYTFIVKAKNSDGVSAITEKRLTIIIHPAYWQTWWFRILISLLLIGILYALYRVRINRIIAQEKLRNTIARDLHDEVGSTLSSIAIMTEMAAHNLDKVGAGTREKLLGISANARNTLENMDDIIWAINPQNDSFINLEDRLKAFIIPLCESKDIAFELNIDSALDDINVDMQKRKNIYLILKEAINNAIKYSNGSKIQFKCFVSDKSIIAYVNDNGKGFDVKAASTRNGIRNMNKRANELHGNLKIESTINLGTSIILDVPIR
jgi:ligand-binding sensor domain-containing protein/two-component sensor histidine kinase